MTSKLQLNIRSLIAHCEEMANANSQDWRLKKYIKSLDTMINELEEEFDSCIEKNILEYKTRCESLKVIANYIETESSEKKKLIKSNDSSAEDNVMREVNQMDNVKYLNGLRRDLLGNEESSKGLRKRGELKMGEDMGVAVKHYSNMQERIAEDMLSLTRNLKEQTETANKIIRKDTEIVSKSSNLSEKNITSLSTEAEKLQDHSKRAWKCWMWLMIGLVMMIFIGEKIF